MGATLGARWHTDGSATRQTPERIQVGQASCVGCPGHRHGILAVYRRPRSRCRTKKVADVIHRPTIHRCTRRAVGSLAARVTPGACRPRLTHCQPGPRRPPALPTPRLQRPPRPAPPPPARLATRPFPHTRRRAVPSCRLFIAPPSRHGPKEPAQLPRRGQHQNRHGDPQFNKPHPAPTVPTTRQPPPPHADAHPMPP